MRKGQTNMWRPKAVGDVVAERVFTVRRGRRRADTIRVRFGRPVRSSRPDQGDPWWCPVEIAQSGKETVTPVAGEDSLQALVLALHYVAETLPLQASEGKGSLEWLGRKEQLIFARAFVASGLEFALLALIGGIFRAVALVGNQPARVRRERERVTKGLRALAREIGL